MPGDISHEILLYTNKEFYGWGPNFGKGWLVGGNHQKGYISTMV
jgi:hypothetical protein